MIRGPWDGAGDKGSVGQVKGRGGLSGRGWEVLGEEYHNCKELAGEVSLRRRP